jgi:hypothetical protein
MDAMYATQSVMGILHKNNFEYLIRLPKKKLKNLSTYLNKNKLLSIPIPGQPAYRKRKQEFYWENNINYFIAAFEITFKSFIIIFSKIL